MTRTMDNSLDLERLSTEPDQRWQHAMRLAASRRSSRRAQADTLVQDAAAYLEDIRGRGRARADRRHSTLAAARSLAECERSFYVLRVCMLGGLPCAEAAARMGVSRRVVAAAEALFFDIKGVRDASSWMRCHVFAPEARRGSRETAAKLRLAHAGGPTVARALLDGEDNLPLKQAQQVIDQETLLHAKLQAALEFELDATTTVSFLKAYLDYDLARRKLELQQELLVGQCDRRSEPPNHDAAGGPPAPDTTGEGGAARADGDERRAGYEPWAGRGDGP